MLMDLGLRPIGIVRSCFGGKFAVPRQPGLCPSAWGELHLHPEFRHADGLRGIDGFSHLWLIFGFHQTAHEGWHPTVRPPRLGGNARVGVFASRSTYRPNALGLSLVRFDGLADDPADGPVLRLGAVDLVDGTPVYDIKPYLPYAESVPDARAGYAADAMPRLEVRVDDAAAAAFGSLDARSRAVIIEALALDPRPAVRHADHGRTYGADLCGVNVKFNVEGAVCHITAIEHPR